MGANKSDTISTGTSRIESWGIFFPTLYSTASFELTCQAVADLNLKNTHEDISDVSSSNLNSFIHENDLG